MNNPIEENAIPFSALLASKLKERGLNVKKLSELSGIAIKHLERLVAGQFEKLPPAPYLRGYLLKIGELLDFDGELWWNKLKDEGVIHGSGSNDRLPENRFAQKPIRGIIVIAIVILVLVLYLGFRFRDIVGLPSVTVVEPAGDSEVVQDASYTLRGKLENGTELILNNEPVELSPHGIWEKAITLEPGLNIVEIRARKFLGGEARLERKIIYEAAPHASAREVLTP